MGDNGRWDKHAQGQQCDHAIGHANGQQHEHTHMAHLPFKMGSNMQVGNDMDMQMGSDMNLQMGKGRAQHHLCMGGTCLTATECAFNLAAKHAMRSLLLPSKAATWHAQLQNPFLPFQQGRLQGWHPHIQQL
eukprot:1157589-Pelagomonas_calceolata.AAC.3